MAGWPRELHGHTVARTVEFHRESWRDDEDVDYRYHCVSCGLQVAGPDDPALQRVPCQRHTHEWGP